MLAVAIGRFHHHNVGDLALVRSGMNHLPGRNQLVAHTSDVPSKQQPGAAPVHREDYFDHARAQDVRRRHEAEGKLGAELFALFHRHCLEVLHARLGLVERVERQRGIVLRFFDLVVERGIFFLEVS